jgi:hypothetical protein
MRENIRKDKLMKELSEENLTKEDSDGIIKYAIKKEVERKIKEDEDELI